MLRGIRCGDSNSGCAGVMRRQSRAAAGAALVVAAWLAIRVSQMSHLPVVPLPTAPGQPVKVTPAPPGTYYNIARYVRSPAATAPTFPGLMQMTLTSATLAPPPYVFLHIGKTGGTTLDSALSAANVRYVGHRHFDWSWIQMHYPAHRVLIVLRDPIQRAISQFYFTRRLSWTAGMKIRRLTLDEYFTDYKEMLDTRGVWQDGEAGMSWIAGTHIAQWVAKDDRVSINSREKLEVNSSAMCKLVEERIRGAFWIGFTETLNSDVAALGNLIGVSLHAGQHNVNQHPTTTSQATINKISALTTMDQWVYKNAKLLVKNRLHTFSACPLHHPCRSTRTMLSCNNQSPFGHVMYKSL